MYSATAFYGCTAFFTRTPRKLPPFNNVIRPFPASVWAILFVVIGVFSLTFAVFHRVSKEHATRNDSQTVLALYILKDS